MRDRGIGYSEAGVQGGFTGILELVNGEGLMIPWHRKGVVVLEETRVEVAQ